MPIFEYRCARCEECFEILVPRLEGAAPHCPRCGTAQVEKRISSFAVGKSQPPPPGGCGSSDCACRNS